MSMVYTNIISLLIIISSFGNFILNLLVTLTGCTPSLFTKLLATKQYVVPQSIKM